MTDFEGSGGYYGRFRRVRAYGAFGACQLRPPSPGAALVIAAIIGPILFGFYGLFRGEDANFDQGSYHFESAHEFVTGRMGIDAAPSGLLHSFFNPLPYVPFYWMTWRFPPKLETFVLGAWQGLNLSLAFALAMILTRKAPTGFRFVLSTLAVAISAAAPLALSEVGSSFSDLELSPFILGGVCALTFAATREGRGEALCLTALGAGLTGLAIGFKLTNGMYVFGVGACCLVGWRGWIDRGLALAMAGAAGALGVATTGGFWFVTLWRRFGNPLFPYYDQFFLSPAIDSASPLRGHANLDTRFLPKATLDALSLHFRWVAGQHPTSELSFRDVRFAIFVATLAFGAAMALRAVVSSGVRGPEPFRMGAGGKLISFFLASYVAWVHQFGIQRYLVGLELLLGPAILVTLSPLGDGRARNFVMAAIAAVSLATVRSSDWGHVKSGRTWYDVEVPEPLERPALALFKGPTSYLAPFLPPETIAVGIGASGPRAGSRVFDDLAMSAELGKRPELPVFLIFDAPLDPSARAQIATYGLGFGGPCWKVPNSAKLVVACKLTRGAPSTNASLPLRPGETLRFDDTVQNIPALLPGWRLSDTSTWIGGGTVPGLQFLADPALDAGPVRLTFEFSGLAADLKANDALTLAVNDHIVAFWPKSSFGPYDKVSVCVPTGTFDAVRPTFLAFDIRRAATLNTPGDRVVARLVSLSAEMDGCIAKLP